MNDELNDKIDRDVPAGDGGHPSRAGEPAGHPVDREADGTVSEESVRAGEQNKQDVEKLTVEEEAAVYAGYHRIYQNLYRSLKGGFKDLAGMKG